MIELSLDTEGVQRLNTLVKVLKRLGAAIAAVELHGIKRNDSSADNAEILGWLADQGRDFVTPSDSDIAKIEKAFVAEVERRSGLLLDSIPMKDSAAKLKRSGIDAQMASEIAGASFIAAIKEWMDQVGDRIDAQKTNNPPFNAQLTPAYEAWKKTKTGGWAYPIGKFTGQLLDNLNSSGPAAGKIRLKKGKQG